MNEVYKFIKEIEKFQDEMNGVFLLSDLKAILPCNHANTFYRTIQKLCELAILFPFSRGVYVAKKFDFATLSQKICPMSYISFETILADCLAIGTYPQKNIRAVKIGKKRVYESAVGTVVHLGIAEYLYFGFKKIDGINYADNEKALLDVLYFYTKGVKFYFDIYSDVDLSVFNMNILNKYIKKYKNKKFVSFVKSYFNKGVK